MRVINPYPYGHPPRNEDIRAALAASSRGRLVDGDDRVLAEVGRAALDALGPALEIREDQPYFDERCRTASGLPQLGLTLEGSAGAVGRLDLYPENRSIYWRGLDWKQWCGWAELREPRALLEWLAALGVRGPLEDVTRWHSEEGERERVEWRKAIPPNLKGPWCTSVEGLLDPWKVLEATTAIQKAGASMKKGKGLLEWYGAGSGPFARRPDYELLPRLVLGQIGFDEVARALQPPRSERALVGAGRMLLDMGPLSPAARSLLAPLRDETREVILHAVRRLASEEDAARLRERLFPAPFVLPEHTALVGFSNTVHLRRPVADGDAIYAVDGNDLVRLAGGARAVIGKLLGDAPMAVREGRLLLGKGDRFQELDRHGKVAATHAAPTPEQVAAARAITASWSGAVGDAALGAPLGPTPEEREAFEAFAHLGLPAPPSARAAGHYFLDAAGSVVVRGEGEGSPRPIVLPGRPVLYAFTASHLVMALAAGEACRVAWLAHGEDVARVSPLLRIEPRALRFLRASAGAALLGVDLGAGEVVLRVGVEIGAVG